MSDRYVEDGSYLRIQNVTIGLQVPKNTAARRWLITWGYMFPARTCTHLQKYSGYDPEVGAFNGNIKLMNVDMGHYPNPRSFTIGANVEF